MINPVTGQRSYLLAYILIWIMISIVQMIVLVVFFDLSILHSFADSMLTNTLHGLAGVVVWYPVRFNPLSPRNFLNPIIAIFITGVIAVSVWVFFSYMGLSFIFQNDEAYLVFLRNSIPNRIITDFLLYTVLVLVYSLIVYSMNLKDKINAEANLRTMVREAELNMLKAQINPHFLFNSLNSISFLTKKNPDKAREMIIKLSDYLRYSLRFKQEGIISFKEEMAYMEMYLDIEKIRFGEKLIFQKNIAGDAMGIFLPSMILQPILENSVKHGVYESTGSVLIELNAFRDEDYLYLSVINDFDPDAIRAKGAGIGLKNTQARLELNFGRTDLMRHYSKNNKFFVELKIPVQNKSLHNDQSDNN